jgi:hypothetical protein
LAFDAPTTGGARDGRHQVADGRDTAAMYRPDEPRMISMNHPGAKVLHYTHCGGDQQ